MQTLVVLTNMIPRRPVQGRGRKVNRGGFKLTAGERIGSRFQGAARDFKTAKEAGVAGGEPGFGPHSPQFNRLDIRAQANRRVASALRMPEMSDTAVRRRLLVQNLARNKAELVPIPSNSPLRAGILQNISSNRRALSEFVGRERKSFQRNKKKVSNFPK